MSEQGDGCAVVTCPECGYEQADMGNNVVCEQCGEGPMPTAEPNDAESPPGASA